MNLLGSRVKLRALIAHNMGDAVDPLPMRIIAAGGNSRAIRKMINPNENPAANLRIWPTSTAHKLVKGEVLRQAGKKQRGPVSLKYRRLEGLVREFGR